MKLYQYGNDFFAYQQVGSLASARAVVPVVLENFQPASLLDVGCGAGAWLAAYLEHGAQDVVGVDGNYVRTDQLLVSPDHFRHTDVSRRFHLGRTFDLVQCLEVAEHLAPAASQVLVDSLVAHAPVVIFSAAPPGQGGENHVNERPYEFWRDCFAERGYALFDFLRPQILSRRSVEHWYRFNMLVFAREDAVRALAPAVAATRIKRSAAVPDHSPLAWRLRRRMLSTLPQGIVTSMARLKHRLVLHSVGGEQAR